MIKDCPHYKKNQNTVVGDSLNCFKCGKPGHVQRNCTQTSECKVVTADTFSAWTSDFMQQFNSQMRTLFSKGPDAAQLEARPLNGIECQPTIFNVV